MFFFLLVRWAIPNKVARHSLTEARYDKLNLIMGRYRWVSSGEFGELGCSHDGVVWPLQQQQQRDGAAQTMLLFPRSLIGEEQQQRNTLITRCPLGGPRRRDLCNIFINTGDDRVLFTLAAAVAVAKKVSKIYAVFCAW